MTGDAEKLCTISLAMRFFVVLSHCDELSELVSVAVLL
jgi:hypothetical protein